MKEKSKKIIRGKEYTNIKSACIALGIHYNSVMSYYYRNKNKGCTIEDSIEHYAFKKSQEKTIAQPKKIKKEVQVKEEVKENNIIIPTMYDNITDLIEFINKNSKSFKKINLIDYENINKIEVLKNRLSEKDSLNICVFNKSICANNYFSLLASTKTHNTTAIGSLTSANQLSDHLIVYMIGALSNTINEFTIISNDNGYSALANMISNNNLKVTVEHESIRSKGVKFTYSLLRHIITHPKVFTQYNIYREHDLKNVFKSYYNKDNAADYTTRTIIQSLTNIGVMREAEYVNGYQYYYIDIILSEKLYNEGKGSRA